jgi:two-component system phosphate regulon response regulator OmpR
VSPILILDDDLKLGSLLQQYMQPFGWDLKIIGHPKDLSDALKKWEPLVLILDVMLPSESGFEILKRLKISHPHIPILMLSARGEVSDKVLGLELGADDYLSKPFEPRELVARVQSLVRRQPVAHSSQNRLVLGALQLDPARREVRLEDVPLELSSAEFELLLLLCQNQGKPLSRTKLIDSLHGSEWAMFPRGVDVLVSRIRAKLGEDVKNPRFIKTVWGYGYVFIPQKNS